ncbi:helix-turn-helix domain-containing protein [Streptomyces sp. NPDC095613]|uniref:helix-turn-helix domain-containing protein n=1 Tax=Streptomyces sp. NPDC095613 TaxID=3155540 RepID=UPI00332A4C4E
MMTQVPRRKILKGKELANHQREVLKAHSDGYSIRAIADECGRSYGAIYKVLDDAGAKMRPRGGDTRR